MFPKRLPNTLTINNDLVLKSLRSDKQDVLPTGMLKFLMNMRNNDSLVRINTFNCNKVEWSGQVNWYKNFIHDHAQEIYIISNKWNMAGYLNASNIDMANMKVEIGIKVAEAYRRQGIGRKSFEFWVSCLFNHFNMKKITLEVMPDNAPAISLYASMGFEIEGLLKRQYFSKIRKTRVDALYMSLFPYNFRPTTLQEST